MQKKNIVFHVIILMVVSFLCVGCQTKIGPLEGTDFVDEKMVEESGEVPFQKVWKKPEVSWDDYSSMFIAPVCSTCLVEPVGEDALGRGKYVHADVADIAQYMQGTFKKAFHKDKNERFVVLDAPEKGCLVLELAIVELVPNRALINLGWYLLGPWTPALTEKAEKILSSRSRIAMEGRVRDYDTGMVVAMFKDREARKIAFISISNYSWYGHVKAIIREWAQQMVKIANKVPGEVIKDSSSITLKPW